MKKRVLSILIVLCMVFTLLPVSAFAATVVDSGTCGDNLTWTLDDEGTLTISGTGAMPDYSTTYYSGNYITAAPWGDNGCTYISIKDLSITKVVINYGVTSIGSHAFQGCHFESVTIPDSVTSIGYEAFTGCNRLASVTIPDSVTSIGQQAFFNCTNLKSVTIGNGVTSIGDRVFENCSSIYSVTIGNSATSIGDYMFCNCTWLHSLTIGNGVTNIGDMAFYDCYNLTSVIIPDSVTSIGSRAFYYCNSLTSVTIGNSVTSIGGGAFYSCGRLASITIPNSMTSIGDSAFYNCSNLKDVYYCGTQQQWSEISIESDNDNLKKATRHYHDYQAGEVTAPTCTEKGYTTYTCSICGDSVKSDYTKATGHSYTATEVTAPTCTEKGYTTYTCSICGDSYKSNYTNATGHSYTATVIAPTCTTNGYTLNQCECGVFYLTDYIPATGHSYTDVVTAPTCTEQGYTTHTCACGDSYVDNYTEALGHDYGDWEVTTAPTCTEKGVETRYCGNCDACETREVEATGHSYTATVTAATTKAMGYTTYTCSVCGDSYKANYTLAAPTISISRSSGKPKISWSAIGGATKYYIYRSTDGKTYKYLTSTTKTSCTNTKASSGKKYYYKVKAVAVVDGKNIYSSYSNVKYMVTTLTAPTLSKTTSNGHPKISWKAVTGADKYIVYYSTDGKSYSKLITTTKLSVTHTKAKAGKTYYYKVKAVSNQSSNATSAYSKAVSIKAK